MQAENKKSSMFSSQIIRRIWFFFGAVCIVFSVFYYGVVFWLSYNTQKQQTILAYNHTCDMINHHLSTKHIIDNKTLAKVSHFLGMNYELYLVTPNGKILSASNKKSSGNIQSYMSSLSNYRDDTIKYTANRLEGWRSLSGNYRLYANVSLADKDWIGSQSSSTEKFIILFLPIFVFSFVLLVFFYFCKQQFMLWNEIYRYINETDQSNTYQRLNLPTEMEPKNIEHVLNRLSYKIHKQKSIIGNLQDKHHQIVDNSPDKVFLTDANLRMQFANARLLSNFKIVEDDLNSFYLTDIIEVASNQKKQQLSDIINEPIELKVQVKSKQTKNRFDLFLNPQYNNNQQVIGFSGTLHDVNHYQNAIEKLHLSQLELDDRLNANEKLWAVMGHELRTPLNGMLGMIQLLSDTALNQEQADFVKTLHSSSDNMLLLLNDMLDLSKLDAGKMENVTEEFDLLAVCREISDLMVANAKRKDLELIFFVDESLPRKIITDSFRLRQILLNLLGNAFKFTVKGHVALLVDKVQNDAPVFKARFIKVQPNQQWVCFQINDTGPGIPEDTQQQLFYFFNQASNTISRNFGGTGLGLAISKGLAEMLGGFIQLDSKEGEGTSFKVYLPMEVDIYQPLFTFTETVTKKKLFVLEPNAINTEKLKNILTSLNINHQIFAVLDKKFIEMLKQQNKDETILLVDNAYLSQEDINALFEQKQLEIIPKILASFDKKVSLTSSLYHKFNGYVEKPFVIEKLLSEILRVSNNEITVHSALKNETVVSANNEITDEQESKQAEETDDDSMIILLAEDNLVNQKVAKKMVEKQGFKVVCAENGEIALELVKNKTHDFKLVLMDCRMPKMDGITATKKIREFNSDLPIIALTANDSQEDREECKQAGMNEFLAKPINQKKLIAVVNEFVDSEISSQN